MSEYIHKAHNVSVLIYHIVCPAKYRRVVISEEVDKTLKETCKEIEKRYEIKFLEIGTEGDHVHFLVQSVPTYSPTKIVRTIKSITAKEIFKEHSEVKEKLWGGEFWSDGHYVSTVGKHGDEETIANYVKAQGKGKDYKQLYKIRADENQPSLFD
jgi:REP element-mobilizing transposase RayT